MGGFGLLPVAILSFFIAFLYDMKNEADGVLPSVFEIHARQDAERFLSFRNQVLAFNAANPNCPQVGTGCAANPYPVSVVGSSPVFSTYDSFLASAGAYIRPTASGMGRVITVYATLAPGVINSVLELSDYDAGCGFISGSNWISSARGASQTLVAIGFPSPAASGTTHPYSDGDVICVTQIGS